MSSLLYGHRSTYLGALARPRTGSEGRVTTAAKQFIEMNLSDPLPLAEVASAAGVSIRTLQAAFRADLRTTPVASSAAVAWTGSGPSWLTSGRPRQ